MVLDVLRRLSAGLIDQADYLLTLARLTVLDWLVGPRPETPTDRAIQEVGKGPRKVFPEIARKAYSGGLA
jgi:hypothetical protein